MKMPTKEQILEASKNCPDAKEVLEKLFPEAFEKEWRDVTLCVELQEREGTDKIGVMIPPEDFYMPYNVEFKKVWEGETRTGNPLTNIATYKLKNGRIYRKMSDK